MRITHEQHMYSLLVHLCLWPYVCYLTHQYYGNVLITIYSGAMNEPVMADTLPLTTEYSLWIVPMSMMSLSACIAQTDGLAMFC